MAVIIKPQSLIALISQAVEVYRQEAYGYLLISYKGKNQQVDGAIAYQTAKRKGFYEIEDSIRAERVFKWVSKMTKVVDGWHTHTYNPRQVLCAKPTEMDIKDMTLGHFEIIVAIKKSGSKDSAKWYRESKGLSASINGYKFLLRCWEKIGKKQVRELKLNKV